MTKRYNNSSFCIFSLLHPLLIFNHYLGNFGNKFEDPKTVGLIESFEELDEWQLIEETFLMPHDAMQ